MIRPKTSILARHAWSLLRPLLIACLLLVFLERFLIFRPSSAGDWNPAWLEYEEAHFEAADGTWLYGWFLEHPQPREVILYALGTGGNMTRHAPKADTMRKDLAVSILIFDYRGYGKCQGIPDEQGIIMDGRAARAWLARRTGRAEQELVLMGRSLGGAVAVDLAQDGARGLILENTFSSLPDVAAARYPWLPARWLMRTRLDSLSKMPNYSGPLLQSHYTLDPVVPLETGQKLFAAARDPGKVFISWQGHSHGEYGWPTYRGVLERFLDRLSSSSSSSP
jgi:fermentation-respiration switch protein FrsA (DUF1100 family)